MEGIGEKALYSHLFFEIMFLLIEWCIATE